MPTSHDHVLYRYLADHDAPCPGCGYNLRGLTQDACPECHQPIYVGMFLGLGGQALTPPLYFTVRAVLLALLIAGIILAFVHLVAILNRAMPAGFSKPALIRLGLGILLALAPAAILTLWEARHLSFTHSSPQARHARAAWAISAAAISLLISFLLLL